MDRWEHATRVWALRQIAAHTQIDALRVWAEAMPINEVRDVDFEYLSGRGQWWSAGCPTCGYETFGIELVLEPEARAAVSEMIGREREILAVGLHDREFAEIVAEIAAVDEEIHGP